MIFLFIFKIVIYTKRKGEKMSIELTVTIKDAERTYKQKFLVYEAVTFDSHEDDKVILKCIEEAKGNFQGEPEDIVIRATMVM